MDSGELMRRRFGGKKEEWQLVNDVTLGGEVITPISYNSSTQEYEVASFPSWASAAIDTAFNASVVVNDFSSVANIPIPYGTSNSQIQIKKTDNTHFVITQGTPTNNITSWQLAQYSAISRLEVLSASQYNDVRGLPLKMIIDNTTGYVSRYNAYVINGRLGHSQGSAIRTTDCDTLGYSMSKKILGSIEVEFILDTTTANITFTSINKQTCITIANNTFVTIESSNLQGDYTGSLWGKIDSTGVYVGNIGITRPDCRIRLYKKII